jgi:uncharacterized Zn finger protein
MRLTEYAIGLMAESLADIDDSNGEVGGVLNRLTDLHLQACRLAKPDPQGLAEWLFRMEISPHNDYADIVAMAHRDLLGEEGLRRYRITHIMESLAKASGNVEELVVIKALEHNEEALQLTWVQFEERATLEHYKKLHAVAERLGVWPEQRERALAKLAETIAPESAPFNAWKTKPRLPDYSIQFQIALWENNLDDA